jgi:hypothetical protein
MALQCMPTTPTPRPSITPLHFTPSHTLFLINTLILINTFTLTNNITININT